VILELSTKPRFLGQGLTHFGGQPENEFTLTLCERLLVLQGVLFCQLFELVDVAVGHVLSGSAFHHVEYRGVQNAGRDAAVAL